MAISLAKGGRVSLSKEAPGLKNINGHLYSLALFEIQM